MLICLNKRSLLHVLQTIPLLLCLLEKNSYKYEIPDKVANRQDGRFDLTWNRTMYHCSTQLKFGTFRTHAS